MGAVIDYTNEEDIFGVVSESCVSENSENATQQEFGRKKYYNSSPQRNNNNTSQRLLTIGDFCWLVQTVYDLGKKASLQRGVKSPMVVVLNSCNWGQLLVVELSCLIMFIKPVWCCTIWMSSHLSV